ncbi:hypothetical protein ACFYYB_09180 [Streptomyces sp. NPDC002886]|uniref:hypothetical protein n=1 Tax=Streptomyces sp. NPDC002886 TaxID=3364667 RepID=UPI0036C927A1
MSYRPRLRSTVIGACTAALLAGSALASVPAQAQSPRTSATATVRMERAEAAVITFFQAYLDATNGSHSEGKDTFAVRKELLTSRLDDELYKWEGDHQTHGIFRRNVPVTTFSTVYKGTSTEGIATVDLTEKFEDGSADLVVHYTVLDNLLIDGLTS